MKRALLVVLAFTLLPNAALAGDPRDQARTAVRGGLELLKRGDCRGALEQFMRAKALFPASYKVEVNLGTALECLGRLPEAAEHFDLFLQQADLTVDRSMIERVMDKLLALKKRVASVQVSCKEAGASVTVDGAEVGRTPLRRSLRLAPGKHRLVVTLGERSFSSGLELAAGEERQVIAVLSTAARPPVTSPVTPAPAPLPALSEQPQREQPRAATPIYKRWWLWTLIGAAVVGGTVGAIVATQTGGSDRMPSGDVRITLQ